MQYAEIIAHEVESLSPEKQAEVLDFIAFLKTRQRPVDHEAMAPWSVDEIESFFRSFAVDVTGYRFDRDDANAR